MREMKVAYFLGSLNRGGTENLICDICRNHVNAPYDFICVYRHEGNMSEDFRSTGAPIINVPKLNGIVHYIYSLRRTFIREGISIVHSQTPQNTLLLSIALFRTGIKIITTFHGYNFSNTLWWQRKIVYAVSKKILCVSNHQMQHYVQKWKLPKENKLQVVYNGIDFSKIDSAKPSQEFANQPRRIRLVMVGNFVSGRSQNIIVKSIHLLRQQDVNSFDFYFIGKKDEKEPWRYDNCIDYCKQHQLDNIYFLGSRGDVPSLLKSMDGFVYSTEHDTFGIAIIEAIAAGLPVVVNDWPVMAEVCNLDMPVSNSAIRFFRTDDVVDCADKIKTLLTNITETHKQLLGDCALVAHAAKQKYSINSHIQNIYHIYQQL